MKPPYIALFGAWALYAVFSSPTPDAPGVIEAIILGLLALAALAWRWPHESWVGFFAALLIYGATVPVMTGVLTGHDAGDMVRDVVAFAALAIPFAYAHLFAEPRTQRHLVIAATGIGIVFAARYLFAQAGNLGLLGSASLDHDFLYLANSPLVAFAGAYLLLRGCFQETNPVCAFGCIVLALIPFAAMIGMVQRATIILLVLMWVGFFIHAILRTPRRAAAIAAGLALVSLAAWPWPELVYGSLRDKTLSVGWNARGAELDALITLLADHPITAIFGAGWGAMFKSPSVGGEWVRFSHALTTAMLWKTGFIGLMLCLSGILALLWAAICRLRHNMILLTALILPLFPALFLYGSYKSLCFGVLLLVMARADWTKPAMR